MKHPTMQVGIATRYKFISVNPDTGLETVLSGWSPNIMLTSGRAELANRHWFTSCKVGTDGTAPDALQTDLLGTQFGESTVVEDVANAESTPPYFGWRRKRFRFLPADHAFGGEILKEVGIGWGTGTGDNLVTRALIVDIFGATTTITPLADEILDVVCEVRYYPPLVDATGTVVIDGIAYDYIMRAMNVTSALAWGSNIGMKIESYAPAVSSWRAFDDDISAITGGPTGLPTNSDNSADWTNPYVIGSYQITFGMADGVTGWNSLTGKLFRSLNVYTTAGYYQIQWDSQTSPGNGIPKTNAKVISLQFILGWTAAVIP